MKKHSLKYIFGAGIAVAALAVILPAAVGAASNLYVNDSQSVLSDDLGLSYAIGSSGAVEKLASSEAYVMTGTGLTTVGSEPAAGHLEVSGTVRIGAETMKVGLDYGSLAVETSTVENYVGSGFLFGYFDSKRVFHEVGSTSQTALTMTKDVNVEISGAGTVGCFHILLNNTYSTFDEAQAAAATYTGGFPAYYIGKYYVLLGSYTSRAEAESALSSMQVNGSVYSASNRCVVVTQKGTAKILFEFDCGSTYSLALRPISPSQNAQTKYKTCRYYGDFQFARLTGDNLTVVNYVNIEDYIKGVVATEMSESWPLEALKAQAVCARTYAMRNLNNYSSYGFDVTCDTYSQAYTGTSRVGANIVAAVESTAGQYAVYNGSLIEALYFSSDGGGTEDSENVFTNALPYLKGVLDTYEEKAAGINAYSDWTRKIKKSTIATKLNSAGYSFGTFSSMEVTYSDTGNAIGLKFTDTSGKTVSITGSSCYAFSCYSTRLGLPSIHYTFETSGTDPETIVFTGGGWGHNVGMSQFGAYAMAQHYAWTYDQILAFYYTGIGLSRGTVS
jgi:stage II sporulation protein D